MIEVGQSCHNSQTKSHECDISLGYLMPPSVSCLVRYQVETNPGAFTVHYENEELYTYHELWQIVKQISFNTRFAPGSIVPLCLDPTIEFVAGLLALMVSGAAYVVLDPGDSLEHKWAIVADTGTDAVLSNHNIDICLNKLYWWRISYLGMGQTKDISSARHSLLPQVHWILSI